MPLNAGERLGPYEILVPLGAGGMGEVYRARDTKLDRDVAIKVLPEALAQDPDRLARFEREAKVLASLNHPNVAQIYGLEGRGLVMELVEGSTLGERIALGAVPVEEALGLARQITSGLEAAHEKGVVHRDLKPANIKVTPEGVVKILDFGLAKAAEEEPLSSAENSPTLTMRQTQLGVILGTAGYMAPEQARGKAVDKRADIWGFGVVLYEMLTGRRLFDGEDVTATLAAVVMKEPDWEAVPTRVRRLLRSCLQKDPKNRLRDIGDVWQLLEEAPADKGLDEGPGSKNSKAAWVATALVTTAALALGYVSYRHYTEERQVLRVFIPPPEKGSFGEANSIPAISPDGRRIVFVAQVDGKTGLWVRDLDVLAGRFLPGTEDAQFPFWSPDSRTVAFSANGKLKKIDAAGGPAVTLCDSSGLGGSWGKNDIILFVPGNTGGLARISAAGGTPIAVTTLDQASHEVSHRYPWFLPDGRHFLFTARNADRVKSMIAVGDLKSKSHRTLVNAVSNSAYGPPGYLLFVRERTLMAQPFDARQTNITGEAVPIAEQVDSPGQVFGESHFSTSQNGILIYKAGATGGITQLTWFDRSGLAKGTVGKPADGQVWVAISPDGKIVASEKLDATGLRDLWTYNLATGSESRFTFGPASNQWPVWSPDGSQIAFDSTRDGPGEVYRRAANGAGHDELVDQTRSNMRADDWSRDGRYIIEERLNPNTSNADIWVLPLLGNKKPFPYVHSEAREEFAKLSPNGQWLAYDSLESKRPEVYVQSFPNPGGKWQVSANGGTRPIWSRDGKELFFIALDGKMMAVSIKGGLNFEFGAPQPLFDTHLGNGWYDVSKDGRFLMPTPVGQASSVSLTVVVNWSAMLKR